MNKKKSTFELVLRARCPQCERGKITAGLFQMARRCAVCSYDLHPENGYYLGAMMLGFLVTALLTAPPLVALKLWGADDFVLIYYPFVQLVLLGPLLIYYAKVIWVHVAFHAGRRLDR